VRCWHGYLSGARCRLECGPDDATAGALKTQVRNSAFRKDGKRMYGKRKYKSAGVENASTENASTMQTFSQIKKFGISRVSVVHFQVGWASGLQIVFFSEIT